MQCSLHVHLGAENPICIDSELIRIKSRHIMSCYMHYGKSCLYTMYEGSILKSSMQSSLPFLAFLLFYYVCHIFDALYFFLVSCVFIFLVDSLRCRKKSDGAQ